MTLERADNYGFGRIVDLDGPADSVSEAPGDAEEKQRSRLLNIGQQVLRENSETADGSQQETLVPLSPGARVRVDELFRGPFSRKYGLSVGDIDALVEGLKDLHGTLDEQIDAVLLDACLSMLLRGIHKKEIAQHVGATPSEVNRMVAYFMRNVRMKTITSPAESEQTVASVIEQDRAVTGRQPLWMRAYASPQQPKEVVATAEPEPVREPTLAKRPAKRSAPVKKTPSKKVLPPKSQTQNKISPITAELALAKNRNLFTRALLRPDVDPVHFDEELGRSLREASDSGVIPLGYKEMLLDDLSYDMKNPRIKGSAYEARRFVFELGKTFPGRTAVDSLQNIDVMRGLFTFYGQRAVPVETLEKASSEKVPVRLLVAGAVTEILDTATAAVSASKKVD